MNLHKELLRRYSRALDVILECVDARVPWSSSNTDYIMSITSKPVVVVLTHCDLAEPDVTAQWLGWFNGQGRKALEVNVLSGKGVGGLLRELEPFAPKSRLRPPRLMVVGLPNVGKSSLINRIARSGAARVGAKPGITRGPQWVKAPQGWELLDTPGVLMARDKSMATAVKLACVGILGEGTYHPEEAASWLLSYLALRGCTAAAQRYGVEAPTLEAVASQLGFRLADGDLDLTRAANRVISDFRKGQLGRISLERPEG
ncbi:MAG: YlqF/YawG family GTPase [Bacillota bacterium]